jgi:hypothetical protein
MGRRWGPRLLHYNCFPIHHSGLHPIFQCYVALIFWQRRRLLQKITFVHLYEKDQREAQFS